MPIHFFLGTNTTFLYMKLLAGIYAFCEVSRMRIPTTKQDIVQLVSCLDDLFAISCLHSNISKKFGESTIKLLSRVCRYVNLDYDSTN